MIGGLETKEKGDKLTKKNKTNDEPDWLDPTNDRKTPYTEEELDLFVEGFISSMDIEWEDLVSKLVSSQSSIDGYSLFNLILASLVVNLQFTFDFPVFL